MLAHTEGLNNQTQEATAAANWVLLHLLGLLLPLLDCTKGAGNGAANSDKWGKGKGFGEKTFADEQRVPSEKRTRRNGLRFGQLAVERERERGRRGFDFIRKGATEGRRENAVRREREDDGASEGYPSADGRHPCKSGAYVVACYWKRPHRRRAPALAQITVRKVWDAVHVNKEGVGPFAIRTNPLPFLDRNGGGESSPRALVSVPGHLPPEGCTARPPRR
ncbi:hypothetical protein BHM03_00006550 [Ensete ventricosum]|nr:hypothetical protein BHM03_00006550 [Ensete ventricosum]